MIGTPRRHYRLVDSTNTRARELATAGARHGTVVTADEQSAGRGRQGRTWAAPPGKALLYSAIVRPIGERHHLLPLSAALAVAEAAESLAPVSCQIKWPNDVWVSGRKVSGILIETRPAEKWAVVGIGLNISIEEQEFPPQLRETATSIGGGATVEAAVQGLNERLGHWLAAGQGEVLDAYRGRDALAGRRIGWADGEGTAAGIDDSGNLVLETEAGEVTLSAGEVHLVVG